MWHGLPGTFVAIDEESITFQAFLAGEVSRDKVHVPHERAVFLRKVRVRPNDLTWHDEYMRRRLGKYVAKSDAEIVLMNDLRLHAPLDDLQEDVLVHHRHGEVSLALAYGN